MHILLTRLLDDCSDTILKFKSLGHQVSHLPLLTIDKLDYKKIVFSKYKGIIFTSANAVKFLEHKQIDKILNVTVDFVAEVITCIKDKDKKIISGDPEKIKKIYDTWVFSRDITSANPNWQLVNTLT